MSNNNISSEKLDLIISKIEDYLFAKKGEDRGEMLFYNFAKENKDVFVKAKLSHSTENNFEFTEMHKKFQDIYEKKIESIIAKEGENIESFYNGLSKRSEEGDQEIILFVDILNEIINYNSFIEMMANLINKV